MSQTDQVWTHAKTYDDVIGPGYSTKGVEVFRGPKHNLGWAPSGSKHPVLHPAYIRVEPHSRNAVLILYNPKIREEAIMPMQFTTPIVLSGGSIDSRVERSEVQSRPH